ncbi:probable serine/threonine-protein kinase DDB_G0271682 [Xenia sp. Carnegie-2017]|uniref:probable serine/threonine-protein kinase DDB_G0271682 n=1 Tax=Xenia sp. Carnegie-2017 TaxID=2897299 RepID=UPI001F047086|nr:probable serine/threonine-protein kinase DDB_G0271682 [Xenia sp. Carnegie-2017]XP_046840715.1 probable serine/threonine-protein kinase DDB_G0271682 [Xenia sp. Carnegie-2017]
MDNRDNYIEIKKERDQLLHELNVLKTENENLKTTQCRLEIEVNNHKESIELHKEMSLSLWNSYEEETQSLKFNSAVLFNQVEELRLKLLQIEHHNAEMESIIQKHEEDKIALSEIIQMHEHNIKENDQKYEKESEQLKMQIETLFKEKEEHEKEKRQLEEKGKQRCDELQREIRLHRLMQRIAQQDFDQVKKENEQLQEHNSQLQLDNQKLQEDGSDLKNENSQLQDQISQIKKGFVESGDVTITDKKLGNGAYGAVYIGHYRGNEVAVKQFHDILYSSYNRNLFEREITIASQCFHRNVLQFICATKNEDNKLMIVTELMDKSLRQLLEENVEHSRIEVKLIALDVAQGLSYLHSKIPKPIIHRDLSSANVLLEMHNDRVHVRKAKIADYGSANFKSFSVTHNPGCISYSAPEASSSKQNTKLDVYSYGVLVCEMCLCKAPETTHNERVNCIQKIPDAKIREMVINAVQEEPEKRRNMCDVIKFWENFQKQ